MLSSRNKRIWYKHITVALRCYGKKLITENGPLYAIGLFKTMANIERQKLKQQSSHLLGHWKRDPKQLLDALISTVMMN